MAKKPKAKSENPLEKESVSRLAACRVWKLQWDLDFKECYFFVTPNRQRQINSQTQPSVTRQNDAVELMTDQAFLLAGDFITEIVNTFMPEAQEWCERGAGMDLPEGVWDKVKETVKSDDKKIFAAMKASNLYAELPKAFKPDLAIGTVGIWIERPTPHQAIVVSAIPLREIECNLGPYGEVDDRFAVRYTRNCYVETIVGPEIWAKVDEKIKKKCADQPSERTQVSKGFWRLWNRKDDEVWQHVVLIDNKLVHDVEMKGEGCCPLLIGRFNPSADWPWGVGPMLEGLPTFRQIDELEGAFIDHVDLSLRPPIGFPSDSFSNVEQGLEPGMAYPIRPGDEVAIKNIYDPPKADAATYKYEEKLHSLKKLFYVDFPEQSGDTPPTLGQWLDEMARAQRRIGTPGQSFWREVPCKIFLRFKYLLEVAGTISPLTSDGRAIATLPYNPAQRAAEQQEIATAVQYLQMSAQSFPEEFRMTIDGGATMKAFAEKMRVAGEKGLIKFRTADQIQTALGQIKQLLGTSGLRQHAGATPPEGSGAPAAT